MKMRSIKKFLSAAVLAALIAGGLGAATLEAKGKTGDSQAAICAYLWSVMTYPYVSPVVLAYATAQYASYNCGQ